MVVHKKARGAYFAEFVRCEKCKNIILENIYRETMLNLTITELFKFDLMNLYKL